MKPHRIKQQNRTKITYLPLNTSKKQSKEELYLLFRPQLTLIYQKKLCAREGYITYANAIPLKKVQNSMNIPFKKVHNLTQIPLKKVLQVL